MGLHRDPIRDLAFNPVRRDQLLSGGQDKCVMEHVQMTSDIFLIPPPFIKSTRPPPPIADIIYRVTIHNGKDLLLT